MIDPPEPTTVAEDLAVFHDGTEVIRLTGLEPETEYEHDGIGFRTLPRPHGELLATVATVNDVHFGETECGILHGMDAGPVLRVDEGDAPYPETMNRAAVAEIRSLDPDTLVVKGDLTSTSAPDEYRAFLDCYGQFGDRLVVTRGNHDGNTEEPFEDEPFQERVLPGVIVAVVDTTIPWGPNGRVTREQLDRLDELGARADRPVLVFGHHHVWAPTSRTRPEGYFGVRPDDSELLIDVFARRPALVGWFAGHSHRNRVRRFPATGEVPWVEVACVKDFPGGWAEYRIFEGGILQVFHRISAPEALAWSERTRAMFGGMYPQFAYGRLEDRCFTVFTSPAR